MKHVCPEEGCSGRIPHDIKQDGQGRVEECKQINILLAARLWKVLGTEARETPSEEMLLHNWRESETYQDLAPFENNVLSLRLEVVEATGFTEASPTLCTASSLGYHKGFT